MDKLAATLKSSLIQHLLRAGQTSQPTTQSATQTPSSVQAQSLLAASSTAISLPPALRQLLSNHGQIHQLLPQLKLLQSQLGNAAPAGSHVTAAQAPPTATGPANLSAQLLTSLLPLLTQQLGPAGESMSADQLRQWARQWFSLHPAQALTQPPVSSSSATGTTSQSFLAVALQWILLQRSGHSGLGQLLRQSFNTTGATTSSNLSATLLNSFANTLQSSIQDIRLSQVHLADTSANQQPEYYLVVPYQVDDKARELEWLLRKEARRNEQQTPEIWRFSLRFASERYGAMLVRGEYQGADADDSRPSYTRLRFYLDAASSQNHAVLNHAQAQLKSELERLRERLQGAGIDRIEHEVHLGQVPDTLAPNANQLYKQGQGHGY